MARKLYKVPAGPSPAKTGIPAYIRKQLDDRRKQHETAVEYVQNRDRHIDRQAKMLSARAGVPYEEARARLEAEFAAMEAQNDTFRQVRKLALGYDEDAIIRKANERLAQRTAPDPMAVLLGTSAGLNRRQRRKG
jgi:hypothetical protein